MSEMRNEGEASGSGVVLCMACGQPESAHSLMISFADLRTSRDCNYIKELMQIERDIVNPLLARVGTCVSGDVVRSIAEELYVWRSRSAIL
jgi:hypothetical protein